MPGIRLNDPSPSFDRIRSEFSMTKGGKDHNIRSKDGETLYTSHKTSASSFKAFFGFGAKLEARAAKRETGMELIRQAIDGQYGKGMSDRVLFNIAQTKGRDLTTGIKRSDIELIGQTADRLIAADKDPLGKFADAQGDTNVTNLAGPLQYDNLKSFLGKNFDVVQSQRFWSTMEAKSSVDMIASALSMTVLDRISTGRDITQRDLDDLSFAMLPYEMDPSVRAEIKYAPPQKFGEHLVGPKNEEKMKELTQAVYDRFLTPNSEMSVNLPDTAYPTVEALFTQPSTSSEQIAGMHTALRATNAATAGLEVTNINVILESLK